MKLCLIVGGFDKKYKKHSPLAFCTRDNRFSGAMIRQCQRRVHSGGWTSPLQLLLRMIGRRRGYRWVHIWFLVHLHIIKEVRCGVPSLGYLFTPSSLSLKYSVLIDPYLPLPDSWKAIIAPSLCTSCLLCLVSMTSLSIFLMFIIPAMSPSACSKRCIEVRSRSMHVCLDSLDLCLVFTMRYMACQKMFTAFQRRRSHNKRSWRGLTRPCHRHPSCLLYIFHAKVG